MEKSANAWIGDIKTYSKCPKCKNGTLNTRVSRSFMVKYILRLDVRRYKCDSCGAKVYVRNHPAQLNSPSTP